MLKRINVLKNDGNIISELDGPNGSSWRDNQTNDDVHSTIRLCPVTRAVMDTPQIQRLRRLKQLGVTETTYMTTTHNRFEHSVGVAHLAEKMLRKIRWTQPKLEIQEKDILCVKLAGLCHDLGHGPFSHVFEVFLSSLKKMEKQGHWLGVPYQKENYDGFLERPDDWCHEDASLAMIDDLLLNLGLQIDEDNLDQPLKQVGDGINAARFGICDYEYYEPHNRHRRYQEKQTDNNTLPLDYVLTSRDWIFIKECIYGGPLRNKLDFIGRPDRNQEFLYDIVCNRYSGLDVDKMDYFARDGRRAKRSSGEIEFKLIDEARVAWAEVPNKSDDTKASVASYDTENYSKKAIKPSQRPDLHLMICYPEKLVENVMNFFQERFRNHQKLYTHKTSKASELMICDILLLSDQFFRVSTLDEGDGTKSSYSSQRTSSYPQSVPISRAMMYPSAYIKLTDSIICMIQNTFDERLRPARMLINRWKARKLYKMIGSFDFIPQSNWHVNLWNLGEDDIRDEITKLSKVCKRGQITGDDEKKDQDVGKGAQFDDIIVEKRKIHHGKKEKDPVSFVRFLPKIYLLNLRNLSTEDLPEAIVASEEIYYCDMPRSFMKQTLRVFCRTHGMEEFLYHVYLQYIEYRKDGKGLKYLDNVGASIDDHNNPAILSQETDMGTPLVAKNRHFSESSSIFTDRKRTPLYHSNNHENKKKVAKRKINFDESDDSS